MVDKQLARAIAHVAIFLEYTSEKYLDEDAAVKAMEQLAGDLQRLDDGFRRNLSEALRLIAPEYREEFRQFIAEMPETFGIDPAEDEQDSSD
jgi:hypothetical protein